MNSDLTGIRGNKWEVERRAVPAELRADPTGKKIQGYAALFGSLSEVLQSEDLGGFREILLPGCFRSALAGADVRALFNHDANMILGRTAAGTLRLKEDTRGLAFEIDLPDTQAARDLMVSMKRGDVNQCSFGFNVAEGGDTWRKNSAGVWIRSIKKIEKLYDVSPVTFPAYQETSCAVRSRFDLLKDPRFKGNENLIYRINIEALA